MALSLQEVSDRMEIEDLVYRYSDLIDGKKFDEMLTVFTADATIDYSGTGGGGGDIEATKKFLSESLPMFPKTQHLMSNIRIQLDGDTASGRVMCFNPMYLSVEGAPAQQMFFGLWYNQKYVRTPEGWRISELSQEGSWDFNTPEAMAINKDA